MQDYDRFLLGVSSLNQELIELGTHVINHAEKQGATQAEAYLESTRIFDVQIEKGLIRLAAEKLDSGCGIRVALGKQLGVSYVTSILENDLIQATYDAISAARASVPDSDFKSFASAHSSYPNVKGLFDKALNHIENVRRIAAAGQYLLFKPR